MAIQRYSDGFGGQFPSVNGHFSTMLDRFFNESVGRLGGLSRYSPHVDAHETENCFEIEASLSGMKREDIKVEFQQGRLTLSGERRTRNERNDRRSHLVESQYGSFSRSF
jgi:HSP20 family protein